jgi:hypothetical protein
MEKRLGEQRFRPFLAIAVLPMRHLNGTARIRRPERHRREAVGSI